jgi:alkanesulfonate monooxygenase SsuD/methylene tetrahydromethanopterin reductase-like flavin-dependent oxidoreductase (luciferase family)
MDPHSSHADIAAKRGLYQQRMQEAGHSVEGRDIPMARLLAIADTEAEAEQVARSGAAWTVGAYASPKGGASGGSTATLHVDPEQQRAAAEDPVQRYMDHVVVRGTPARVIDQLKAMETELPMNYLLAAPLSHRTFELFTRDVLPQLV